MKTIFQRELLDHLKSVQFSVLLAAGIILFAVNGIVFVQQYSQLNSDYRLHVTQEDQHPSTVGTSLFKSPSPLMFMAEGGEKNSPLGYYLNPKQALSAMSAGPRNFKMPEVPELDWAFIIKMVFSLYVIFLGFETISGEKERGTLRLALSNPVGRVKLLTAKYLAILASAVVPLLVGLVVSLIIIGLFLPSILGLDSLLHMAVFLMLSLAYLSLFAFLSLFFSSLVLRSSLVLLVLLAFWIVFAFIIPDVSSLLAEKFAKAPSEYHLAKLVGPTIQKEVWARIEKVRGKIQKGELKTEKDVLAEADAAFLEGQDRVRELYDDYDKAMQQRADLSRKISRVSPVALFQYSAEAISETGPAADARFLQNVRNYSRVYDDYILKKVGKVVGTSPWGFSTDATLNGKRIYLESPSPKEYDGDKSDFPRYSESKPTILGGLGSGLWDIAGLVIWNIILAGLAFSAFLRSDVR
jgi:ABC-type transport system involved in multi-copper enzyme maturation permease subunit